MDDTKNAGFSPVVEKILQRNTGVIRKMIADEMIGAAIAWQYQRGENEIDKIKSSLTAMTSLDGDTL